MSRQKLRNSIAREAARLMLRGKETEYATARKRAARWLSRRKLDASDIPSAAEIQAELCVLAGLFAEEHQTAAATAMRVAALELMAILEEFEPHVSGSAVDGSVINGASIVLDVRAHSTDDVARILQESGFRIGKEIVAGNGQPGSELLTLSHGFPCEIVVMRVDMCLIDENRLGAENRRYGLEAMRQMVERSVVDAESLDEVVHSDRDIALSDHPDVIASFKILLSRLEQVQFESDSHPEGDALYHTLQVFELGVEERPYDEEFLLACLLHDAGLAVDRRDPVNALIQIVGGLITARTRFFIENLAAATDYLRTGQIARSLRRSEDFDDLVRLACCDRDGRERGAGVRELAEALDYVAGLETAWDAPEGESA